MPNLVDTDRLQTIFNFAAAYKGRSKVGVTVGYIYKQIERGKVEAVKIDGITFVVLPEPEAGGSPTTQVSR